MGHGLKHPGDLVAWRRWHEGRHPVRSIVCSLRSRLRPPADTRVDLLTPGAGADLLVAVEATHASVDRAVVAPLAHLPAGRTAIVASVGWQPPTPYAAHTRSTIAISQLPNLVGPSAILAAGHYTEIGAATFALADERDLPFFVSQHGALTPFAPPLPRAARLLAWSAADGDFWAAGRADVEVTVVGSQLLWGADDIVTGARTPSSTDDVTDGQQLTYLGQGHAAEIPRRLLIEAALLFCREHGATYRPHPSEKDRVSLMTLNAYQRAGITVDGASVPLADLPDPVVSVFSTGVLEAAARGRDAWVDFPRPPAWLGEFWERYSMSRFGSAPTPAPVRPDVEPAQRIAEILMEAAR